MDKCTFVQHNPVILLFLGTSELEVTMPELGEFIFNDFVPRKERKKKKKKRKVMKLAVALLLLSACTEILACKPALTPEMSVFLCFIAYPKV